MTGFISYKIKISVLLLGLIFFLQIAGAQNQSLEQAEQFWQAKNLPAAKEQILNYTNSNGEDAKGWLLKARIFAAISDDETLKYLVADGRMDAFKALEKALNLDKKNTEAQLRSDSFALPLQLYNGYVSDGIKTFNAATETQSKQTFGIAFGTFGKASLVGNFIFNNGWGSSAVDTATVFYLAKAAIQAQKAEDAAFFIRKLVDANITGTIDHKEFQELYEWLVYYYRSNNNKVALEKYTAIAEAAFPLTEYFPKNYIDWLRQQKEFGRLFTAYEDMFAKGFTDQENRYLYALDIFNYLYPEHESDSSVQTKFYQTIKKYIEENRDSVKGRLLFAKFYINQAAFLQKWIKAVGRQDAGFLAECNNRVLISLRSSNKQLLAIINGSKKSDRKIYTEAVELLVSNFTALRQPQMARKYQIQHR